MWPGFLSLDAGLTNNFVVNAEAQQNGDIFLHKGLLCPRMRQDGEVETLPTMRQDNDPSATLGDYGIQLVHDELTLEIP